MAVVEPGVALTPVGATQVAEAAEVVTVAAAEVTVPPPAAAVQVAVTVTE